MEPAGQMSGKQNVYSLQRSGPISYTFRLAKPEVHANFSSYSATTNFFEV